jgi:acetyl esterase
MSVSGHLRRRLGALIFDKGLTGVSYLGRLHPRAKPERHGIEVHRNLPYLASGHGHHLLDVYVPRSLPDDLSPGRDPATYTAPHPVVLYIHGGAFRILSKDTHWVMALAFARRGFLVFSINYRLAPRHPFPAALQDAAAAFQYICQHAAGYGGDLSRLVLAGESAGANLVTALSLLTLLPEAGAGQPWAREVFDAGVVPRAVLPMCGILQVSDAARFARRRALPVWIQDRLHETSDAYIGGAGDHPAIALADPLCMLEQLAESGSGLRTPRRPPAYLATVGTRDPLLDDTRRLGQALCRLGIANQTRYYEDEVHAFQALVFRKRAQQAWADTYAFLDQHLR